MSPWVSRLRSRPWTIACYGTGSASSPQAASTSASPARTGRLSSSGSAGPRALAATTPRRRPQLPEAARGLQPGVFLSSPGRDGATVSVWKVTGSYRRNHETRRRFGCPRGRSWTSPAHPEPHGTVRTRRAPRADAAGILDCRASCESLCPTHWPTLQTACTYFGSRGWPKADLMAGESPGWATPQCGSACSRPAISWA